MPEIQEYRGIRGLKAALLTSDTADTLSYDEVFDVAGVAELSKTVETSSETHYYDNIAAIVIDGVGADTVTCTCSALPLPIVAKLTGQTFDEDTNTLIEGDGTKPYLALGYITENTAGEEVFVWRHKVKCAVPDSTHATKDAGTTANGQTLVFTGINTQHKFTKTGKTAKAINHIKNDLITEQAFFTSPQDIDTLTAIANNA